MAGDWIEHQAQAIDRVQDFCGILGLHAERAGMQEPAVHWYQRAGNRALSQSAFIEADQFFERALALVPKEDREQTWKVLLDRARGVHVLGDSILRDQITRDLLALAEESQEVVRLAEAYYRRGGYFESVGDGSSALDAIGESLKYASKAEDQNLYLLALAMAIVCHTHLGQFEEAESRVEEALTNLEVLEDESDRARILTNAALYFTNVGDLSQAAKMYQGQVEVTHRLGNKDGEAIGLMSLAYINMQLGMYEKACEELEESLVLNEAMGARRQRAYVLLNLVLAYWRRGDCQRAQEILQQVMPEFEAIGDVFGLGVGMTYAGLCAELAVDHVEGSKAFREASEILSEANLQAFAQDSLAGLARCQLAQGDQEGASHTAEQVWAYLQKGGGKGLELPINAYLTCATVFEKLREPDKAKEVIEAGYQELIEQATKISDAAWCASYMDNVPEHRAIQELWDRRAG
jgi:tetratricopeptide (TPR) repeat protein